MRARSLWLGLGILFAILLIALIALNFWVRAYLRSDEFRRLVSARTGQALKADAALEPLQWSGSSVFSNTLDASGESGAPLAQLGAQQLRAEIEWRAIFDGVWRVERIDIVRLDAEIRTQVEQEISEDVPGPTPEPAPPKKGFLPNRFELGEISVQDANFKIGPVGKVGNSKLVIRPEGKAWVFEGRGGRLELTDQAPLEIDSFRIRTHEKVLYLTQADLRSGQNGRITASGQVGGEKSPYDILIEWNNVDAANVMTDPWKDKLSGTLSGNATLLGRSGAPALISGRFLLAEGHLEGLPVQSEIARFTRSPQFKRMPLHEVSGDYIYDGVVTDVQNFVAESRGLLRMEGACRIGNDGSLEGNFKIGVTPQTLQWLPGSQEKVFTVANGGYLWTDIRVGGTLEKPTEDLSGRLAQAAGETVIQTGIELIEQAPNKTRDAVRDAFDILAPLIR